MVIQPGTTETQRYKWQEEGRAHLQNTEILLQHTCLDVGEGVKKMSLCSFIFILAEVCALCKVFKGCQATNLQCSDENGLEGGSIL